MRDLVRKNDYDLQVSLKKLSKLLNLNYEYVLEKLNDLIEIEPSIAEHTVDYDDDGKYIGKEGLIILIPFLEIKVEDTTKTLYTLLELIYDMQRQEIKIWRRETKYKKIMAYREVKDYLDKKINQKKI